MKLHVQQRRLEGYLVDGHSTSHDGCRSIGVLALGRRHGSIRQGFPGPPAVRGRPGEGPARRMGRDGDTRGFCRPPPGEGKVTAVSAQNWYSSAAIESTYGVTIPDI